MMRAHDEFEVETDKPGEWPVATGNAAHAAQRAEVGQSREQPRRKRPTAAPRPPS